MDCCRYGRDKAGRASLTRVGFAELGLSAMLGIREEFAFGKLDSALRHVEYGP